MSFPGLQSSDKYLREYKQAEAARQSQKKLHKKIRKKHKRKKGQPVSEESEEDISASLVVSTQFEAPEVRFAEFTQKKSLFCMFHLKFFKYFQTGFILPFLLIMLMQVPTHINNMFRNDIT
jgi:hypothetical protein